MIAKWGPGKTVRIMYGLAKLLLFTELPFFMIAHVISPRFIQRG